MYVCNCPPCMYDHVGVEPRLILNYDQVWTLRHRGRKKKAYKRFGSKPGVAAPRAPSRAFKAMSASFAKTTGATTAASSAASRLLKKNQVVLRHHLMGVLPASHLSLPVD